MGFLQGLAGNYTKVPLEELNQEFSKYLLKGETISRGYKLIRDILIFTNSRIISFDKQGTTGRKMRLNSIYLNTICRVSCETAGFGLDDSEITVHYIQSLNLQANSLKTDSHTFEFPRNYDISKLYVFLETWAQKNLSKINNF